ncbi:MAG: hypothetical protein AAFW74_00650, partial [Pseudomonadota bacterium]
YEVKWEDSLPIDVFDAGLKIALPEAMKALDPGCERPENQRHVWGIIALRRFQGGRNQHL